MMNIKTKIQDVPVKGLDGLATRKVGKGMKNINTKIKDIPAI